MDPPTWRYSVHGGVVLEEGRRDPGHVRPVGPGVHHDRQDRALVVDIQRKVAAVEEAECRVPDSCASVRGGVPIGGGGGCGLG